MRVADVITEKLTAAFAPESLRVVDESHQHEGHAGHRQGGQTHYRVYIVAEAFRGKSRIDRHRLINQTLAQELGGRAVHFEEWAAEFEKIDIVISSTSAPHYILDRVKLEPLMHRRRNRPLLLIDIAVPRDIEPEVNFLENVYLYNIDDLQAIADDYLKQRQDEIARCDAIIAEKTQALIG